MGSVKVSVYGRIKPRQNNAQVQDYKLKYGDHEDDIIFSSKNSGKKVFRFKKIFAEDATQKQVFETVAKPVIESVFQGYNGTIFTYGQTGSGKTHSMTGSLDDWNKTGLIPRTLQEVFDKKEKGTVISVAYFEIYNEHIYDLVRSDRVDNVGNGQENIVDESNVVPNFRNLSVHVVNSACDALQLFRRGDANKMVAETSSNARSSRSHVIFSIGFEFPHPKEEVISLKPVLYLVDLAGSERINKCKTPMSNPWETRYINLSLHYLEQVLVALRQPGRAHIPYRNSLMTALLRNSLGGNCITCMVATFSLKLDDIEETMQTCRFAERIALIKNEVKLSELTTPRKEIETLKKENERLKTQLKLMTTEQLQDQLNDKDKEKCSEMVQNFLRDNDFFALPLTDVRRMEFCFHLMRDEILQKQRETPPKGLQSDSVSGVVKKEKTRFWNRANLQSQLEKIEAKIEKVTRRKRNPLDLPKVNITYKKWKSVERFPEKEDQTCMKGDEKSDTVEPSKTDKLEENPHSISLFEDPRKNEEYLQKADYGFYRRSEGRPLGSNIGLKVSGESKKKNIHFINNSSSDNATKEESPTSISPAKSGRNTGAPNKTFSYEISEKVVGAGVEKEDNKLDIEKNAKGDNFKSKDNFSALPLTGDKEVDEEIIKFYKSRYQIFKNKGIHSLKIKS